MAQPSETEWVGFHTSQVARPEPGECAAVRVGQMDKWERWTNESAARHLLWEVNLPHLLRA